MKLSYEERQGKLSAVAARLFDIIVAKKTNLCASLDVRTTAELLSILDSIGPHICMVKTHIDIIDDFECNTTIKGLKELAAKHNFLIFEDRKFADIGSTVKAQYAGGVFKIAQWADITTAHGVPGPGIVSGLEEAARETTNEPRGLVMLAELSSRGTLAHSEYSQATVEIARTNRAFVFGFIAQQRVGSPEEDWVIMTPGVGLDDKGDGLGQQYRTVDEVIKAGTDVIIVGRGLYGKGRDPVYEAKRYKKAGWDAYTSRIDNASH